MPIEGPGDWSQEIVWLGGERGITVLRGFTDLNGVVVFETPGGDVEAAVYKARMPDVPLVNVAVYLVQRLGEDGAALLDEYALMVDDPYWGRRVQGNGQARYEPAPYSDSFIMGYRVKGRVLHDGEAVAGACVSLEGVVEDVKGTALFWDSLEYNGLMWSEELETWVQSAELLAPIMTGEDGRWSFILPKGHGAIYQRAQDRRDDTAETAAVALPRKVTGLWAVHRGRRAALAEDVEAVIDVESGRLVVHGEPGAWVRVSTMDDIGWNYLVQPDGTATVEELPAGDHAVVQFRYDGYGEWDSSYGCARRTVTIVEGETATVNMGAMEYYNPAGEVIAGRVYERLGVAAAGVAIVPINFETGEVLDAIATTDGSGYWEAEMPEEGFGGDPWIRDPKWGSMPALGYPYSDVVLGARAYSAWAAMFAWEAWRKGTRGHSNFQYVERGVYVKDSGGERFETVETGYGGWATEETLPKWRYVGDVNELLLGPQIRSYDLWAGEELILSGLTLASQSFEEYETLPGQYRAAGWYPEFKRLIGGKIHGGVVTGDAEAIGVSLPEAARIGLEFGRHEWFTQLTVRAEAGACWGDLVCPYCGGPAWRDPDAGGYVRGHCVQCADAFGSGEAMDCRTHFTTPTLGAGGVYTLEALQVVRSAGQRTYDVTYHWRPDLHDENDNYLVQDGPGQATNAPRWFAKHVDEVGDGVGFGEFDAEATPAFTAGHDLEWFGELPEVDRNLGLTQMKLVFPNQYMQAEDVTVELDCRMAFGEVETVQVTIPAGTAGANGSKPLSDAVRVRKVGKWTAEGSMKPYPGSGFYEAVEDVRLVGPAGVGCRFTIVNDVPLLASSAGMATTNRQATPVALQLGKTVSGSGPHLCDDAVGQIFLFYAREGEIMMRRRSGLPGAWQGELQVTNSGNNSEPCAEKDEAGRLRLWWQRGESVAGLVSVDDGDGWV